MTVASPAARSTLGRRARPFIKWAGGKRQLLSQLEPFLPAHLGTYIEPFLGGGAVFFGLEPERALLSDLNRELIGCYQVIRDEPEALLAELARHVFDRAYFYALRAHQPGDLTPLAAASRFIYLNKSCYNGLYRVNSKGQFNVPFGRFKSPPRFVDADNLRLISTMLRGVELAAAPYQDTLARAQAGDFVYLDPPYDPLSTTANFTAYTSGAFSAQDQRDLAGDIARSTSAVAG